jgi:hypothetical protein
VHKCSEEGDVLSCGYPHTCFEIVKVVYGTVDNKITKPSLSLQAVKFVPMHAMMAYTRGI